MAFDTDPQHPDLAALETRQAGLRAFVEGIADKVMGMALPETYIEADRSVRAIRKADRFLQSVPPDEGEGDEDDDDEEAEEEDDHTPVSPVRDPYRLRLRVHADKVMAVVLDIPKPVSFLEAERAARYAENANTMLLQLYTPRKAPRPAFDYFDDGEDEDEDEDEAEGEDAADTDSPEARQAWADRIMGKLDRMTCRYAERYGFWPTGATYDEGKDDPNAHIYGYGPEPEGDAPETFPDNALPEFVVHRVNSMALHRARHHGHWPDGHPFDPDDPPYVRLSANFGIRHRPADDETREGSLWWIVRNRRDGDAGPEPPT